MQKVIAGAGTSRPAWETLETFAHTHVQGFIQQLLEDEVTELLGRAKPERRTPAVSALAAGYPESAQQRCWNHNPESRAPADAHLSTS